MGQSPHDNDMVTAFHFAVEMSGASHDRRKWNAPVVLTVKSYPTLTVA